MREKFSSDELSKEDELSKKELKAIYKSAKRSNFSDFYSLFSPGIRAGIAKVKAQQPEQKEIMLKLYKAVVDANDEKFIAIFTKYKVDIDVYYSDNDSDTDKTFLSLVMELDTNKSYAHTMGLTKIADFLLASGADITKQPYLDIAGNKGHSPLQIVKAMEYKKEVDKEYNAGGLKTLGSFFKYANVYHYTYGQNIIPLIQAHHAELIKNSEPSLRLTTVW